MDFNVKKEVLVIAKTWYRIQKLKKHENHSFWRDRHFYLFRENAATN